VSPILLTIEMDLCISDRSQISLKISGDTVS